MKVDSRGRVRFGHNRCRYELTRRGLAIYRRYDHLREESTWGFSFAHQLRAAFRSPEFREKMHDALATLAIYAFLKTLPQKGEGEVPAQDDGPPVQTFTTDIFIPKHMRAV